MCANYQPVTRTDRLLTFFGVDRDPSKDPTPSEVWPLGLAPFIRGAEDESGNRVIDDGIFGMIPPFAKELAYGKRTYNARSETVDTLPTYKAPWAKGQRCIIPARARRPLVVDFLHAHRQRRRSPSLPTHART